MSMLVQSELPRLLGFAAVALLNRDAARGAVHVLIHTNPHAASKAQLYSELAMLCSQRIRRTSLDQGLMHVDAIAEVAPRRRAELFLAERCGFFAAQAGRIARSLPDHPQDLAA